MQCIYYIDNKCSSLNKESLFIEHIKSIILNLKKDSWQMYDNLLCLP